MKKQTKKTFILWVKILYILLFIKKFREYNLMYWIHHQLQPKNCNLTGYLGCLGYLGPILVD